MPRTALIYALCLGGGLAAALGPVPAAAFETKAREALVVDHTTGLVLFAKEADRPMPPASMSKLMTLYLLFEAIRDGKVTLDHQYVVSTRAQNMGGSRMFLEAGTRVSVEDLIRGIIVQSGNDACVVVAEGLAGSEEEFAAEMTQRARELGMTQTTLKNASGWPEPGHVMSAKDLVTISRRIVDEFPEFYAMFKETEFTWNGITQRNRNPLLELGIGADGLKTGHTTEAGYGLTGSAVQDGQRIVFVVAGLGSMRERATETEQLVRRAFSAFRPVKFFEAGEAVGEAEVWLGAQPTVPLVAPRPLQMLVPAGTEDELTARIVYRGPVEAPIAAGQVIASLVVDTPGQESARFDLAAGQDVPRGGLMRRITAAATLARGQAAALIARGE